jgi:5-methylthioadenosine/S-adenosylhomocysteine deaminase
MILIKNTTIVTQNDRRQIIKKGAIFIEREKIVDLGPTKKLEKKYGKLAKTIIDGKNKVVMPGLINAHTHAAMTLLRGYADDMPLQKWLTEKIWPAEGKMTAKDIFKGTVLACQEMLRGGTTTFFDMYWQGEAAAKAVLKSGLRGFVGPLVIDLGSARVDETQIEALFAKIKPKHGQILKITVAPHSIYTVGQETLKWCKNFADKHNLLLHIHLSETQQEVKDCLAKHNCRPVEYLEKIGFLGDNVVAAHVCWLTDKEIKILAKHQVSVAHCPASNLKLVSGIMPLSKLQKAGINVCLGTDGPSSNNSLDMFEDMKIAALIHKWNEKNPEAANAQIILDLATINGAKALKIDGQVGSIDIGKEADIVVLNFDKPHLKPCFDVVSHIVYAVLGGDVEKVIVAGKVLL